MKKVLFIAYLYPPIANSGTQRSAKFSKHLAKFGWEPHVLTVSNPPGTNFDESLLSEVSNVQHIYRVPLLSKQIVEQSRRFLPETLANIFEDKFEWRLRNKNAFPDVFGDWISTASQKGIEICQQEDIDLIYCSGPPWSVFVVGQKVKAKTGIPLVLDYRDLWTEEYARFDTETTDEIKQKTKTLEMSILQKADHVIATTNSAAEILKQKFNEYDMSISCITNGYDKDEFHEHSDTDNVKNKKIFTFAYTGVWKKGYSPKEFIESFIKVVDTNNFSSKIDMAGFESTMLIDNGIQSSHINVLGHVNHKRAIEIMHQADCLFLMTPDNEYGDICLPGKLFEYIASGTPILAYIPKGCEIWKFLESFGGAICVERGNKAALEKTITDILAQGPGIFPELNKAKLRNIERQSLTEKLANVFDNCVSKANTKASSSVI